MTEIWIVSIVLIIACAWACAPDFVELTRPIYCRIGRHAFIKKSYKCAYCQAPKKHPHLKLLDGGKKVFERKRKV